MFSTKRECRERADTMRCERCWSEEDVAEYRVTEEQPVEENALVYLCCRCRSSAPRDPILFRELFLRFASKKELSQHYDVENEMQAFDYWCRDVGLNQEVAERLLSNESDRSGLLNILGGPTSKILQSPFGYVRHRRRLAPSPTEAVVVRHVFQMCIEGETLEDIAEWLNRKQVPSRRNGKWYRSTVRYLLRNPLYAGYTRRRDVWRPSPHTALVDPQLFQKVQETLTARCRTPAYKALAGSLGAA